MLTGSELYAFELARFQAKSGHEVLVTAPILGGEIGLRLKHQGVQLLTPRAVMALDWTPDIYHVHHPYVLPDHAFHHAHVVATLHDLQDGREHRGKVQRWIVVREDQRAVMPEATWIPNGFDTERFFPMPEKEWPIPEVLCVGNFRDTRRAAMLEDLLHQANAGEITLRLVGNGLTGHVKKSTAVTLHASLWDIEIFLKNTNFTASLFVGRTTLEGYLCGRRGWIYQEDGTKELTSPPEGAAALYGIERVAKAVEAIYREVL
jgi:hypothetical protein